MDTTWIGFINRFIIISYAVLIIILINYPPTRPAINAPHRKTLTAIGIAYITCQVIIAINVTAAPNNYNPTSVAIARIIETLTYVSLIAWGIVSLNEKTAR